VLFVNDKFTFFPLPWVVEVEEFGILSSILFTVVGWIPRQSSTSSVTPTVLPHLGQERHLNLLQPSPEELSLPPQSLLKAPSLLLRD